MSILFSEAKLGDLVLHNHIVMAPMTRSRAAGNIPNSLMATYYAQRATAGLIVTEGTSPSPNGLGYPRIPGLFSSEQVDGWRQVTDAVRQQGGHMFCQLMHTGRIGHPLNLPAGGRVLAPSAIACDEQMYTDQQGMQPLPVPEAMSRQDIEVARDEFVQAARNAVDAGFDGIELHSANGYLLEQFIRPTTNQRDDDYGGPIENRARLVLDTARACCDAIGRDKVGIRLSPFGEFNQMPYYDDMASDYEYLARQLEDIGVVYIHLVDHSSMGQPEVPDSIKRRFREIFRGCLILSGGYDAERAEADLAAGHGDLVAVGKPWIANPDLAARWQQGAELNEPDFDTFYTPGEKGYTDYPALG
jgi:N-ethylmaleimide reductase